MKYSWKKYNNMVAKEEAKKLYKAYLVITPQSLQLQRQNNKQNNYMKHSKHWKLKQVVSTSQNI